MGISSSFSSWFSQLSASEDNNEDSSSSVAATGGDNASKDESKGELEEGTEQGTSPTSQEEDSKAAKDSTDQTDTLEKDLEIISAEVQKKIAEESQKLMTSAYSFGNYLFSVASETTKKVSSNLNETASSLKKTVENQTILGELNREQNEFIRTKQNKKGDGAVPVWCGYMEEEIMKEQMLALSQDVRNFMRNPPNGVQFQFEMDQLYPVALATLKGDAGLRQMRFKLVPTKVKEETFWRNYFYRVSLIKQSAQLSTLADSTQQHNSSSKSSAAAASADTSSSSCASSIVVVGSTATGTILNSQSSSPTIKEGSVISENADAADNDDISAAEFESDAFESSEAELNPEDLEREMRELGMSSEEVGGGASADGSGVDGDWDVPVWEKEIQKALQAYEVVSDDKDESWDQEIEEMLTAEDNNDTTKTTLTEQ